MIDIVERLREVASWPDPVIVVERPELLAEAADEIERLRKTAIETMQEMLRRANEIERLRAALHAIANRERPSTARSMARRALEPKP